jgi:hypothetical protein
MLRSLIFGRLHAYWLQNTQISDFYAMAVLLACCLMARSYSFLTLKPLFEEASVRLQAQLSQRRALPRQPSDPNDPARKTIIFHLEYHPRGIQRSQVHQVHLDTLAPFLADRNLVPTVPRPRNVRDQVCSTWLPDITGENPSDLITNISREGTVQAPRKFCLRARLPAP